MKILFSLSVLCCSLVSQGDPTNNTIWSFVEVPNTSYPGASTPGLDPGVYGGCWMPPSQCPPLSTSADTNIIIRFSGFDPSVLCFYIYANYTEPTFVIPNVVCYPNVGKIVMSNHLGNVNLPLNLPTDINPSLYGFVGISQLVSFNTNLSLIKASNVLSIYCH